MSNELPPLRYGKSTPLRWNAPPEDWVSLTSVEARERILQARIAEQDETLRHLGSACDKFRLRVAELEADAERYRWLRDEAQYADDGLPYVIAWKRGRSVGEQEILAEEELDAAIDAARKA